MAHHHVRNLWSEFTSRLTDAGVKADVCFEYISGRKINGTAGEAEMAADRGFWPQLRNSFGLGRGTSSCKVEHAGIRHTTSLCSFLPINH